MDRSCLRVNAAYSNDLRRWLGMPPTRRIGHQRSSCFSARRLAPLHLHSFLLPLWHFQYRPRYGLFQLHGSFRRHPPGKQMEENGRKPWQKRNIVQLNFLDLDFDWSFPKVIQVILQTPTIIDGLRRCSRSVEMQASRPGRELITFLIICNLSMWFMETLEIKSYETNMDRIHFYGEWLVITAESIHSSTQFWHDFYDTPSGHPLWTLLSHVTLPLTLFYRFHSASCLVDIWKSAYEAPEQWGGLQLREKFQV